MQVKRMGQQTHIIVVIQNHQSAKVKVQSTLDNINISYKRFTKKYKEDDKCLTCSICYAFHNRP